MSNARGKTSDQKSRNTRDESYTTSLQNTTVENSRHESKSTIKDTELLKSQQEFLDK